MLRYWSTICLFFVSNLLFAQKQITNFDYIKTIAPDKIQVLDTINNELIFKAYTKEGFSLWHSDGTKEGTGIFTTVPELNPNQIYTPVKVQTDSLNQLFFISNYQLFKSDGKKLELVLPQSYSLSEALVFRNEVYVSFRENNSFSIYQLDLKSDSLLPFEKDVNSYFVKDGKLFLIKSSSNNLKSIIKYEGENKIKILDFVSQKQTVPNFKVEEIFSKEYYLLADGTYKLVKPSVADHSKYILEDLGSSVFRSYWKDENNDTFIAKNQNDTVSIYKINSGHSLSLVLSESYAKLTSPINDLQGNYFGEISLNAAQIFNHKLIYTAYQISAHAQIKNHYLCEYDLTTKSLKHSEDLGSKYSYTSPEIFTELDSNIYEVESHTKKIKYDFNKMEVLLSEDKLTNSTNEKDSIYQFQNRTLLISDNIYNLEGSVRTPLMLSDTLFHEGNVWFEQFETARMGENTFLWLNNIIDGNSELWKIDSLKNTTKIADYKGKISHWKTHQNSAYFVLETLDRLNSKFYETDGTPQGTKLVYEINSNAFVNTNNIKTNNNGVLFELTIDDNGAYLIHEESWDLYTDLPAARYSYRSLATNQHFFFIPSTGTLNGHNPLYKFDKGSLNKVLDDTGVTISYKDKLIFSRYKLPEYTYGLFYLDENLKINTIEPEGYIEFQLFDKWLIYGSTLINIETGEVLDRIQEILGRSLRLLNLPNGLAIIGSGKTLLYDEKNFIQVETPGSSLNSDIRLKENGIIYSSTNDPNTSFRAYCYLDFSDNKAYEILPNSDTELFSNPPKTDYAFFNQSVNDNKSSYYWNTRSKELVQFEETEYQIQFADNQNLIIKTDGEISHWKFDGQNITFIQKLNDTPTYIDGSIYQISHFEQFEIARVANESLENYEELIPGDNRVNVISLFHHQDDLYAYGYSNLTGPQVWHVGGRAEKYDINAPDAILSNSLESQNAVMIFPNPTSDFVKIETSQFEKYAIYSSTGILVKEGSVNPSGKIMLKNLPSANYFLVLSNSTERITKRIFKN